LGTLFYKKENNSIIICQDKYDQKMQTWEDRDKRGPEPKECKRDNSKSLGYFNKFLQMYPQNRSYPNVLMQAALIYLSRLEEDKAYELWSKLVNDYSSSTLVPQAHLRIGEYHYNNRKWRNAIESYKKVSGFQNLKGKSAALAIYHLAESYNNIGDYELAAAKFFEYIVGSDNGKYPSDLRGEALIFMAGTFADLDNGIDVAQKFLGDKEVKFKDTLYYEIGMKNKSRDRLDEAVYSFNRLLEINPDYVDAPLADIAMINILEEKQEREKAHEARLRVVKAYDNQSSWYRKNKSNKKSVTAARKAIRESYFQIPAYHHRNADKLDKSGDTESAKVIYLKAIKAYNSFLSVYPEPHWDQFQVHTFMAVVHMAVKDYKNAIIEYNWLADVETSKFGRKTKGYPETLKQPEAGYNAVVAADMSRADARKAMGDDPKKSYNLPETKAYFKQVEKYLATYGSDPKNPASAELAYNSALIHYEAEQYQTSIKVLTKLKKVYPNHKYIKEIMGSLANSNTMAGNLEAAEKEYEALLPMYAKTDTNYVNIGRSIAAVQFQTAEKYAKGGKHLQAANAYLKLQKRFPRMTFSDKAIFEAGVSYEKAKKSKEAAAAFLSLHTTYPKSSLGIKAILRAASVHKKAEKYDQAAKTFLIITNKFPRDSMAFQSIGFAAVTYDSIPGKKKENKMKAARTYELALAKFPKHEKTPSFLFNACLTYEEIKEVKDAIRCNETIVKKYPKSSYALDAAFSVPVAYEKGKIWDKAAAAYVYFAKNYQKDKRKVIASHYGAAKAYKQLKNQKKAKVQWQSTIESFDKFGLKLNVNPTPAAEAAYELAMYKRAKMDAMKIAGKDKKKAKLTEKLTGIMGEAIELLSKSATYNTDKWTFKSTNEIGGLFVLVAKKVREQECPKNPEKKSACQIQTAFTLPSFYEKGQEFFQKNIDIAREQGYYNPDVINAEDNFVQMFYRKGEIFLQVAAAFRGAPLPKVSEDDALDMGYETAQQFLDEYQATIDEKAEGAEDQAMPQFAKCIEAAAFYKIKNDWSTNCQNQIKEINPDHEALKVTWDKFDPTTLFKDPIYFKAKARIEQVAASTVMSENEKLETLESIKGDAAKAKPAISTKLEELRKKWEIKNAPAPGTAAAPAAK
jgi:tetratricopeptide (TPR) repeat protein